MSKLSGAIKRNKGVLKTAIDPLGIGHGDAIFGKDKAADYSAFETDQQAALEAQKKAYEEFAAGGAAKYETGTPLSFDEYLAGDDLSFEEYLAGDKLNYETLSEADLAQLGPSAYDSITTDPRYADAEFDALRSLEERSKEGLTLQDQADLAKLQSDVSRRARGRQGAIQQNMQARGVSGSGMDLLAQMQNSQDATEMEALASLEKAAQAQNNKRAAANDMGSMATRLRGNAFQEDAAKAQARDTVSRFNTQNTVTLQNKNVDTRNAAADSNWQRTNATSDRNTTGRNDVNSQNWQRTNATSDRNTTGRNDVNSQNWQRANATSDRNTGAGYDFRKDKLGAQNQNSQNQYNASTDKENRQRIQNEQERQASAGKFGTILGAAGGVVGGIYGGPQGAAAGYGVGNAAGQGVGNTHYDNTRYYNQGGLVQGDHPINDTVPAMLSKGEVVIPRSIADDPAKASEFVAEANGQEMDAVAHLLAAMQLLNRKK